MAIVVFSIGILGVFAMQIVSIQSNDSAHRATEATALSEFFTERLRQDATHWTNDNATDLSGTTYLNNVADMGWQVATPQPVGPLGTARDSTTGIMSNRAVYCVAYRLGWAVDNEVLAGSLRVYLPKMSASRSLLNTCLSVGGGTINLNMLDMTSASDTTAVRKSLNVFTIPITLSVTHVHE